MKTIHVAERVALAGASVAGAQHVMTLAHQPRPYSWATRGNMKGALIFDAAGLFS